MKSIRNIMLAVLCGISCSVVGMDVGGGAPTLQAPPAAVGNFSKARWLMGKDRPVVVAFERRMRGLNPCTHSLGVGALLALSVGGVVGTVFITKKMVHLCKEAIVLKKQIQENPKDRSLRNKRRTLIRKAVGMGIGGMVVLLISGVALVSGVRGGSRLLRSYEGAKQAHTHLWNAVNRKCRIPVVHSSAYAQKYAMVRGDNSSSVRVRGAGTTLFTRAPVEGDWVRCGDSGSPTYYYHAYDGWNTRKPSLKRQKSGDGSVLSKFEMPAGVEWSDFGFDNHQQAARD